MPVNYINRWRILLCSGMLWGVKKVESLLFRVSWIQKFSSHVCVSWERCWLVLDKKCRFSFRDWLARPWIFSLHEFVLIQLLRENTFKFTLIVEEQGDLQFVYWRNQKRAIITLLFSFRELRLVSSARGLWSSTYGHGISLFILLDARNWNFVRVQISWLDNKRILIRVLVHALRLKVSWIFYFREKKKKLRVGAEICFLVMLTRLLIGSLNSLLWVLWKLSFNFVAVCVTEIEICTILSKAMSLDKEIRFALKTSCQFFFLCRTFQVPLTTKQISVLILNPSRTLALIAVIKI